MRISLKGFSPAPFTAAELERAAACVEEALALGAPGVSCGIMYMPECFNSFAEYAAMLRPLGRYGRPLTAHIRGEGDGLVESVEEVIRIAEAVGCPLEISHFKSCGMQNWGREIYRAIDRIENRRLRPVHVHDRRHAAQQHFGRAEQCAHADVVVGLARFERPDMVVEPLHEGHIVSIASLERHGHVAMGIH